MRYRLLIISLFAFLFYVKKADAQCPFDNTYYLSVSPPCPGTSTVYCAFGGEYIEVDVLEGLDYTFSTCGGGTFDSQLTLYDDFGFLIDDNDDYCGLQSSITWTADYTGTVFLMLDMFPCQDTVECMDITITCGQPNGDGDGCNTDVILCQNFAGPFSFGPPGPPVSSCLDWYTNSQFTYIMVNITTTGPLSLLIEGNGTTGYLDVSVFDIPEGLDPCDAIQDWNNEIGCNYAEFWDGCNQFGTFFPCTSTVPSPMVTAGQTIMIVVEDWQDGESSEFTLSLGPLPNAQSGPPSPVLLNAGPFCESSGPFQLQASDMGGVWSGPSTTVDGIFDPSDAGIGFFDILYEIGNPPCYASSTTTIEVIDAPDATFDIPEPNVCSGESTEIVFTGTPNATVTYTIDGGVSQTITLDSNGEAILNYGPITTDIVVEVLEVTLPGSPSCTTLLNLPPSDITVLPGNVLSPIFHD